MMWEKRPEFHSAAVGDRSVTACPRQHCSFVVSCPQQLCSFFVSCSQPHHSFVVSHPHGATL